MGKKVIFIEHFTFILLCLSYNCNSVGSMSLKDSSVLRSTTVKYRWGWRDVKGEVGSGDSWWLDKR